MQEQYERERASRLAIIEVAQNEIQRLEYELAEEQHSRIEMEAVFDEEIERKDAKIAELERMHERCMELIRTLHN